MLEVVEQLLRGAAGQGGARAPHRLADGRIGYPLSGRGPGHRQLGLMYRVRRLYPAYTDAQIMAWLNERQRSGERLEATLRRLEVEYRALGRHLQRWIRGARDNEEEIQRELFRTGLMDCWQRNLPAESEQEVLAEDYWWTLRA